MADTDPLGFLVAPISAMIEQVGASVASASVELNRQQLAALQNYPPELIEVGLTPTIFHMQSVEVELKLALHLQPAKETEDTRGIGRKAWDFIIGATPVNANYQNGQEFDVSGASSLRMHFAPGHRPAFDDALSDQSGEGR